MVYNWQHFKVKKIIGIVLSLAAVVILSSFVIAHNVNNDKVNNLETISANDGWEYYKTVTVYYESGGGIKNCDYYVFKKTVCGDPDYLLSIRKDGLCWEMAITKNYNYGNGSNWTSEYKYTANNRNSNLKYYFNCYLQGWDR